MKYDPLPAVRKPAGPVALIVDAGPARLTVLTDDGETISYAGAGGQRGRDRCYSVLAALDGWTLYSTARLTKLLLAPGADRWTGWLWRHALVKLRLDGGPTVFPLRRALDDLAPVEAAGALFGALDWLAALGVSPGGLGAMAGRLWRASLLRPVHLFGMAHRDHLYGGRQECPWPGDYRKVRYFDLPAAYPTAMAGEPYPSRIREVGAGAAVPEGVGYSRAGVRVPEGARWGPLPMRVAPGAVCYVTGTEGELVEGWWTWRDLRTAVAAGCDVELRQSFAGLGALDLFGPWWEMARPGRELPGGAARIVKAVTSTTWGRFAMHGDRARTVRWADTDGRHVVSVSTPAPTRNGWAAYIAAETTARVRDRLYRDGLAGADSSAIYCDTDGFLAGYDQPAPHGWAVKADMPTVQLRGPQCYRWTCAGCGDSHAQWHYCVSGAVDDGAASLIFRRAAKRAMVAAAGHDEIVLPQMPYRSALAMVGKKGTNGLATENDESGLPLAAEVA